MTRRIPNGYMLTVDGREVRILRHTPTARERRTFGLSWRVFYEVEDASPHRTLREAIAEARDLVRREPYYLIVRTRTRPDLPGLRVGLSFEEGVRMIESLEVLDDSLTFELTAVVQAPAAA